MRSKKESDGFASDPSKRCDMGLLDLLGLLDDRALLKKARLTDLILVLILSRSSRNDSRHLLGCFCALNTY